MNPLFKEYDVVKLITNIDSPCVPAGTIGTVLMVFNSDVSSYEVEFVDSNGEHIALCTVSERDLKIASEDELP